MIKKLVSHLGEYKRAAILTPIFSALEAIMDVMLPTIMAFIIDQGIEKGDMNAVVKYGLLTFLVAAIALLLGVLAGRFAATASTGFAGNLRDAMYENIQHFSFSNIDKYSTAGLVTRMTTDVTNLQNAFQMIERMYKIRHHRLVCFVAGKVVLLPAYRSLLMEQPNLGGVGCLLLQDLGSRSV